MKTVEKGSICFDQRYITQYLLWRLFSIWLQNANTK